MFRQSSWMKRKIQGQHVSWGTSVSVSGCSLSSLIDSDFLRCSFHSNAWHIWYQVVATRVTNFCQNIITCAGIQFLNASSFINRSVLWSMSKPTSSPRPFMKREKQQDSCVSRRSPIGGLPQHHQCRLSKPNDSINPTTLSHERICWQAAATRTTYSCVEFATSRTSVLSSTYLLLNF